MNGRLGRHSARHVYSPIIDYSGRGAANDERKNIMVKKILIAAGTALSVVAASLAFQSPATAAGVNFSYHLGNQDGGIHLVNNARFGQRGVKRKSFGHNNFVKSKKSHVAKKTHVAKKPHVVKKHVVKKHVVKKPVIKKHAVKKHFVKKHVYKKPHLIHKRHYLTNREIRYYLRKKGLYNIRFIDRHRGVAKVIAYHPRGYVGKYLVNAKTARILDRHVLRYL